MLSDSLIKKLEDAAGKYPCRKSALLPALEMAQAANGNLLDRGDAAEVAERLGTTTSQAWGVATYYTMFNTSPVGRWHLQVDTNVPGMLAGADAIVDRIRKRLGIEPGQTTPDKMFTLSIVEDLGSCGTCPVIQVNGTYYENMTPAKVDRLLESLKGGVMPPRRDTSAWSSECGILLRNRGNGKARSIKGYKAGGGYAALEKARGMSPGDIVEMVKQATVKGRGGAGFPAGMKWGFLPKDDPRPVYLICNADEGEPGTFKDRQIMEYDPHLLIEGIAIAARAIKAAKAFIYIRGEFGWIADILDKAVAEAGKAGLLKECGIVVHRGAGSYECGEETALIESLEGKRGVPRIKPPFPANVGLYGCPTIVNNVETLAVIPFIVQNGAEAFKAMGSPGNFGPKLFGVSGHVNKPGVYEYPLGTPLMEIIEAAGGVKGNLKGVIVGGLSVPILTADEAKSLKMDFDSCAAAGTMLGSGGVMVINDSASIPKIALRAIRFYAHESCGQCTPCREGSAVIARLLGGLVAGTGTTKDIDTVLHMCDTIMGTTLCPTGDAFSMPIRAMVRKFRSEFEALVK